MSATIRRPFCQYLKRFSSSWQQSLHDWENSIPSCKFSAHYILWKLTCLLREFFSLFKSYCLVSETIHRIQIVYKSSGVLKIFFSQFFCPRVTLEFVFISFTEMDQSNSWYKKSVPPAILCFISSKKMKIVILVLIAVVLQQGKSFNLFI